MMYILIFIIGLACGYLICKIREEYLYRLEVNKVGEHEHLD